MATGCAWRRWLTLAFCVQLAVTPDANASIRYNFEASIRYTPSVPYAGQACHLRLVPLLFVLARGKNHVRFN